MIVIHSKTTCKSYIVFTKTPMALTADVTCVLLKARFAFLFGRHVLHVCWKPKAALSWAANFFWTLSEADAICVLLVVCQILHVCFLEQGCFLLVRS